MPNPEGGVGSIVNMFVFAFMQVDAQAESLARISTALIVVAVALSVIVVAGVVVVFASLRALRAANRAVKNVERAVVELQPRAAPLIDRVTDVVGDARDVTDNVRRRVTDLMDTVADLNESLRDASTAAQLRVREFAAVLDVVQAEAERLLLDTAATASGISRTAQRFHERRAGPGRRPPRDPDLDVEGTELAETGSPPDEV